MATRLYETAVTYTKISFGPTLKTCPYCRPTTCIRTLVLSTVAYLNDWFPSVCLSWPYAVFAEIAQCTLETNVAWGSAGNEATVLLNVCA